MGYYINHDSKGRELPNKGKGQALVAAGDALQTEPTFKDNLVVVINNGPFEAVGYCYSEEEFHEFNDPRDTRLKSWYVVPEAKRLSGYKDRG